MKKSQKSLTNYLPYHASFHERKILGNYILDKHVS